MITSTISPSLKIGLGVIGMWPDSSCRTFFWFFYMATLVAMQYFQYSYFFARLGTNDFSKLMDGLSITLDYTLTFLKLLSLWYNRRIFADILTAMNDDWNNCSTYSHSYVMTSKANLAHRCSNVMIFINSLSTIFYFIGSFVSHRTLSTGGEKNLREFPMQVQFPFDAATDSPIFEIIVLGLFLHVWETAAVIALLNSLILTLVLHVSGQIDIMCQGLREIPTTKKSRSSAIRLLIEKHQRIISLSNNIENYFSFVALIQFIWNTVVICSIGIMIVISLGMDVEGKSGLLIQSIMPYIAVTLEAFVFCFAGEYLSTKSKSISDAAYETLWYELSTSECRILLLVIVRSQKRLTITAGKVMDLTLEGFTALMKASASYMSVLHAMY
ncbi:PREDICTED: odorant receptor 13a-like isoform X2 [Vollenhovia emeryi]|uniref:odorant receptor 13a-like isoform X2 n=1 Tax=Vollenhovia emeryi TaxID=411798 RepID=UPI0005F48956|nr:PREDICTED: odorant receptor 13a-like isoform X2 [Vollenhovia emeryi]